MRSVPVVAMEPDRQLVCAMAGGGVCVGIGPLAQCGLDEAFGLAICLWGVGFGANVPEAEALAGFAEGRGEIAGSVVGHDPLDSHAEALVVGDGGLQEGNGAFLAFGGHDLSDGNPGVVVDADMHELPADAACPALTGSIAGDAVPDPVEAAQLLDVDVDELARVLAFVASHWLGRFQGLEAVQAQAPQDPADRGRRDTDLPGDLIADPALAAQFGNPLEDGRRRRLMQLMGP